MAPPRMRGRYWHLATLVVAAVALILQLVLVLSGQNIIDDAPVGPRRPEALRRLVSYFTIQANFLVAVSAWAILTRRTTGRLFRVLRLTSLVGISVTGVVAAIALPPSATYTLANLVCDRMLHIVVPVLAFVGWIVFGPRGAITRGDLLPALAWPVLWLVVTLTLAPVVRWYPYPFLDVGRLGAAAVAVNCAFVAGLFLVLSAVAFWADRRLPGPTVSAGAIDDPRGPAG